MSLMCSWYNSIYNVIIGNITLKVKQWKTLEQFFCLSDVNHDMFVLQVVPYWLAQFCGAFFSSAVVYGVYIGTHLHSIVCACICT